jgi:anti-sigma regulatory factor (Ser/Thr protein kinase)
VENTTETASDIVLSFPAQTTNLRIARLTASSVATDLGFGLEDTEDLRVAVTELSSALIEDDEVDSRLELRFRVVDGAVQVEGRRSGASGDVPELDPIARELLAVTTDEHELDGAGGDWSFSVRKGPSAL